MRGIHWILAIMCLGAIMPGFAQGQYFDWPSTYTGPSSKFIETQPPPSYRTSPSATKGYSVSPYSPYSVVKTSAVSDSAYIQQARPTTRTVSGKKFIPHHMHHHPRQQPYGQYMPPASPYSIPYSVPQQQCPTPYPVFPIPIPTPEKKKDPDKKKEDDPDKKQTPPQQPDQTPPQNNQEDRFGGSAPQQGTEQPVTMKPNFFGDRFAGGLSFSTVPVRQNVNLTAKIAVDGGRALTNPALPGTENQVIFIASPDQPLSGITVKMGDVVTGSLAVNEFLVSVPLNRSNIEAIRKGSVITLNPDQPITASNLASSTGGISVSNGFATITGDVILSSDKFVAGRANIKYDQVVVLGTPNPSTGGAVGRVALSDELSLIPKDRFIFNFDYFQNAALTGNGWDVYRYVLGFERTFFDGLTSLDVRFPFASTLNSDVVVGGEASNIEFGNIRLLGKILLYQDEVTSIAGGMSVTFPTADDFRVSRLQDGAPLLEINNSTFPLNPFVGVVVSPDQRFYFQSILSLDIDPAGNSVYGNLDETQFRKLGNLTAPLGWASNTQLSYFLIQDPDPNNVIQSLGPFVEFHYRSILDEPDVIRTGSYVIGENYVGRQEFNLTTGFISRMGNRYLFSAGIVLPLLNETDRTFDFQAGFRFNVLLGPNNYSPNTPNIF